jgi:hypothetical protein
MNNILFVGGALASVIIIYQDFKHRRINLMLTLLFVGIIVWRYFVVNTGNQLLWNTAFCLMYFLMSYLVLRLYFFARGKGDEQVIDSKIGWGDIILLFAAGCTIEPEIMVFFFSITFVVSLLCHLIFSKRKKTIPLAAYLLIFYNFYLIVFANTL